MNTHAKLCGNKIYDAGLLEMEQRGLANTDLRKVQMWSCRRMLLLKFYELAVLQRGVWGSHYTRASLQGPYYY